MGWINMNPGMPKGHFFFVPGQSRPVALDDLFRGHGGAAAAPSGAVNQPPGGPPMSLVAHAVAEVAEAPLTAERRKELEDNFVKNAGLGLLNEVKLVMFGMAGQKKSEALAEAVKNERVEVISFLIGRGVHYFPQSVEMGSPVFFRGRLDFDDWKISNLDYIRLCLDSGAPVSLFDAGGKTLVHMLRDDSIDLSKLVLAHVAKLPQVERERVLNAKTFQTALNWGEPANPPLHCAVNRLFDCIAPGIQVIRLMVEAGARRTEVNSDAKTAGGLLRERLNSPWRHAHTEAELIDLIKFLES